MMRHTNLWILFTILGSTWFFGEYLYPYFAKAELYVAFLVVAFSTLWMLRKRLGWKYFSVGVTGLVMIMVFFVLTSPHRMIRIKQWFAILFG